MEIALVLLGCGKTINGKYFVALHDAFLKPNNNLLLSESKRNFSNQNLKNKERYSVHPRQLKRNA